MSGAQQEAAFDESVFDAPNDPAPEPAAKAAPAPDPEPEPQEPAKPSPAEQIKAAAKKSGWSEKDEWRGDPDEWVDAPEFILKAVGEVLPSMRKSMDKANEEISGLKQAVKASIQQLSKADQRAYERARLELQAELKTAAAAGRVEDVEAITEDIVKLAAEVREEAAPAEEPKTDPDFATWRETAPWFGTDDALTAAFNVICEAVREEGYSTPKVGLKEAERRLREEFPTKFAKPVNPNRSQPGAVEGGGQARRTAGKSFSDMPKENQEMCLDLMKLSKAVTRENYAKEYFAGASQ